MSICFLPYVHDQVRDIWMVPGAARDDPGRFELSVSNANGVLSTTVSVSLSKGGQSMSQSCQRALTVRNNVVIDTEACRKDPGDAGINVANQIAAKVDKQ